ncbi:serine hydrolase domain-containing protein [Candidatus Neomarinimicrobiota bacterium]
MNKKLYFQKCIFKHQFLHLIILATVYISSQCSDKGPTNNFNSDYTPPELINTTWETIANPESAGWSTEKLQDAYEFSKDMDTAALMLIYQGKVLYHWGDLTRKYWVHSCRKSFMSALYGIHVDEDNIDISKTMGDLGIDDNPPSLSNTEKTATVQMLLQSRSGIYHPAAAEAPSMKAQRPERHSHEPGTFWYYNNWDFNALGTIFEQETGKKIFENLKERIADPIGMEDFEVSDGHYQYESLSIHPAYPFRMSARDMARFGLLFLQNGVWEGDQIVSEQWINESITPYSDTGNGGDYGYMWWITGDQVLGNLNKGSYYASGYNGHYIFIIPDMDLVVVHRVNTDINDNVSSLEFFILLGLIVDAKKD